MSDPARHRDVDLDAQTAATPAEQFLNKYAEDVLASLGDGLILLDVAGRVVFMSPGAEDLTAVSAKHASGKAALQVFAAHYWLAERITAFLHGEGRRVTDSGELAAPFGRRAIVRLTASPVIDRDGTAVGSMLLLHDVVATRSLTETGERGSRVGELAAVAAGLAHEIKNPLGGIKGAAQLLADTLSTDPEGLRFTSLITREVDRVSALLEQLLELTRPPRLRLAAVNVHRLLQEVLTLEHAAVADTLALRCNFDPSLPDVWVDEAQIRQVFLNLVKNALEAMERKGTLTITTRMETDFHVRAAGQDRSRQYLSVDVEDSGPGIEPEDYERIFTPFFTTKNKGTGLGLAVSHRLVTQHGGLLRVESEPGRWTRFRVSLPVAAPGGDELMARVLIADDEESIRLVLSTALSQVGHDVETAETGGEALARLIGGTFDVAILDVRMPDMSGLDVLARVRETDTPVIVIVITAQNTMANAIEAMKRGAFNYLTKPFDLDEVRTLVTRASEMHKLKDTVGRIRTEVVGRYEPGVTLIGTSVAMQEIFKTIGRLANSDATVLIEGESGTGKELIARAIHVHSPRWSGPFVALNCSAIPRDLLESELFGHERGAFTGASERRVGRFETAGGGTLFLDEVGDMPIELQVKLLRVLQEREFSRVGSTTVIKADARIIAATNQGLERAVRDGRFREDLYFRLKVVPIAVPPLRERRGDIPQLIRHFLAKTNAEMGTDISGITPDAEALLVRHPWQGNVRELENTLVRAAVLAPGQTLTETDLQLPEAAPPPALAGSLAETLRSAVAALVNDPNRPGKELHAAVVAAVERPLIELVLEQTGGNQLRAADLLGINRNTLRKKLTALGIPIPRGGP